MSIKKSQAILKCFISIAFDTENFFELDCLRPADKGVANIK